MRNRNTTNIALGGVTAALAVTVGCLTGLIPVATYVIPLLQCIILQIVLPYCGKKISWAWYGAVALLNLFLCLDKEAAAVFLFLGYYPIMKPAFDKLPLHWVWKSLFFGAASSLMYGLLIVVLGMDEIAADYAEMGTALLVLCMVLGWITFMLLDMALDKLNQRLRRKAS